MIGRIGTANGLLQKLPTEQPGKAESPSLATRFSEQLRESAELIDKAETSAVDMTKGDVGTVETILALSRAELALRHVVSVRNRALEAYQEVMRLPL